MDYVLLQPESQPELAVCLTQLKLASPQPGVSVPSGLASVPAGGSGEPSHHHVKLVGGSKEPGQLYATSAGGSGEPGGSGFGLFSGLQCSEMDY